jgi:hypothetical protein
MSKLEDSLNAWMSEDDDDAEEIRELKARAMFLAEALYHDYVPTKSGTYGEFWTRLEKWMFSAEEDWQRRLMFKMLKHIFYVGRKEVEALYQTAYSRNVAQWLIDIDGIRFDEKNAFENIKKSADQTFFTEITDSFGLRQFLLINNLQGRSDRFQWRQWLKTKSTNEQFEKDFLQRRSKVILFEDFVGSGSQMESAVIRCCSMPSRPEVLLCPLIICPDGAETAKELAKKHNNLTYSPVFEIGPENFLKETPSHKEAQIFKELRRLVESVHHLLKGSNGWGQDYGPYGFNETGGLVVTCDNCPDNTLPMIHRESDAPWAPLFLRNSREKMI